MPITYLYCRLKTLFSSRPASSTVIHQHGQNNYNTVQIESQIEHWRYERENLTNQLTQCWKREGELILTIHELDAKIKAASGKKAGPPGSTQANL